MKWPSNDEGSTETHRSKFVSAKVPSSLRNGEGAIQQSQVP